MGRYDCNSGSAASFSSLSLDKYMLEFPNVHSDFPLFPPRTAFSRSWFTMTHALFSCRTLSLRDHFFRRVQPFDRVVVVMADWRKGFEITALSELFTRVAVRVPFDLSFFARHMRDRRVFVVQIPINSRDQKLSGFTVVISFVQAFKTIFTFFLITLHVTCIALTNIRRFTNSCLHRVNRKYHIYFDRNTRYAE